MQYSEIEKVNDNADIKNRAINAVLKFLNIEDRLEINTFNTIPARCGLGSSSSFIIALLKACHELENFNIPNTALAKQAITIERDLLKEPGGIKDQIFCSTDTGLSLLDIQKDGKFTIRPISDSASFIKYVEDSICLLYVGNDRPTFKLAEDIGKPETEDTKLKFQDITHQAIEAFENEDIFGQNGIAQLVRDSWELKRLIAPNVTTPEIDTIYDKAIKYGCLGFYLLGAGTSGVVMCMIHPDHREDFIKDMGLYNIEFHIDTAGPTTILR